MRVAGILCLVAVVRLGAQGPAFEVATFKRANGGLAVGEGSGRPTIRAMTGSLSMRNASMEDILEWAYRVQGYQVSGPGWLGGDRYEIDARAPAATVPELRQMLQTLLAQRVKLALHRERKAMGVYEIVRGKGRPELQESQGVGEDGIRRVGPGLRLEFQRQTVGQLADFLALLAAVARPVVDASGLGGTYDFTLDLSRAAPPGERDAGQAVSIALEEQLGLRLESRKRPMDVLVIDRVEKLPAEN